MYHGIYVFLSLVLLLLSSLLSTHDLYCLISDCSMPYNISILFLMLPPLSIFARHHTNNCMGKHYINMRGQRLPQVKRTRVTRRRLTRLPSGEQPRPLPPRRAHAAEPTAAATPPRRCSRHTMRQTAGRCAAPFPAGATSPVQQLAFIRSFVRSNSNASTARVHLAYVQGMP